MGPSFFVPAQIRRIFMNFERFFTSVSTFWEPCLCKTALMKTITPFPAPVSVPSSDVVVLSCHDHLHFDPAPLARLFAERDMQDAEEMICRMLEDIAMRLDMLQAALAEHAFSKMERPARRIAAVADQIGLTEVSVAVDHVRTCLLQQDAIALDATMARLERGFDVAVSEVWGVRDL